MGRDKALLDVGGTPLWQRQRDVLRAAGAAEILLSARADQSWTANASGFVAVVPDAAPDCGPLGGLVAALERAAHPHLAVLAIDLPRLEAAWFTTLLSACAPGVGAVGRRGDFFEPLAAIYPCELLLLARDALARREYSLQRLLTAAVARGLLRAREIAAAESPQFENWNEPSV